MSSPQDLTSQAKGRLLEDEWAKETEGSKQVNSGSVWFSKLDTTDKKFLWSVKYTDKKSFSVKQDDIKEVVDAVEGPGGVGLDKMPAMMVRIGSPDYDIVILRKEDFLRLATKDVEYLEPSKQNIKRARSRVPQLLRGEED